MPARTTTVRATCQTKGCPSSGQPIAMPGSVTDLDGTHEITQFFCGPCGQPITDVVKGETTPEPEPELAELEPELAELEPEQGGKRDG